MATRTVLGTCHHDCPDSCGWVVTVEDGVATKLRGNPTHPFSQGELCPKVNRFLDRVYSPDRILHPLIRSGAKGSGQFETVSWDEALARAAAGLQDVIAHRGGEAVLPWFSAGTQGQIQMSALDQLFFGRIGASELTGSLCGNTARVGVAATNGTGKTMDPMDLRYSRLILLWGTNTRMVNRHLWPTIEAARKDG
ncbi:MAG TPA: molybdopterin-dependent oxidoreductase, partial [Acidimicrobiales bacterium]|nr:molybdopterin-dependent oxidoreductase [Acidimicrobiales bacterium]